MTINKYLILTIILLSLALSVSQHTIYTQSNTIKELREIVAIYKEMVAINEKIVMNQESNRARHK